VANVIYWTLSGSKPYQAPGTIVWTHSGSWAGNNNDYFGYAVRPFQANNTTTMGPVSATQDNNLVNTTSFAVTVASAPGINGTLLQFTAVQVTP
jgi:hypothetical protein